ncbi:type VII secretion system-associated protein [Streptomyces zaomyceticus]|uniref:type VII secretion system-associated protein n=1 Tax=Streptomyces zaomyceticus TaxID=68286 RepID=UPI0036A96FCD
MAEQDKAARLDRAWLERFLEEQVIPFRRRLEALLEDDPRTGTPSMWRLTGGIVAPDEMDTKKPLAIGLLADDKSNVGGDKLNESLKLSAESIHQTVSSQVDLFRAIEDNLRVTIREMVKSQKESLEKIEGRAFLRQFEDVSDILSSSNEK